MYAYQFHNMQIAAEQNGWTKFTVMQPHYNLLYREDEREMIPLCREQNVAIMPYSPLASGHLARPTWNSDSLRGTTDDAQHDKYDPAQAKDMPIIERVAEIAQRKGVLWPILRLHGSGSVALSLQSLVAPSLRV